MRERKEIYRIVSDIVRKGRRLFEEHKRQGEENCIRCDCGACRAFKYSGMVLFGLQRLVHSPYLSDMGQHLWKIFRTVSFFCGGNSALPWRFADGGCGFAGACAFYLYADTCIPQGRKKAPVCGSRYFLQNICMDSFRRLPDYDVELYSAVPRQYL